jgi:hypothetical protein
VQRNVRESDNHAIRDRELLRGLTPRRHILAPASRREVDSRLRALRTAADARNLPAAADQAARLGARVQELAGRRYY